MTLLEALEKLKEHFGSWRQVAHNIGCPQPALYAWRKGRQRVSKRYQLVVYRLVKDIFGEEVEVDDSVKAEIALDENQGELFEAEQTDEALEQTVSTEGATPEEVETVAEVAEVSEKSTTDEFQMVVQLLFQDEPHRSPVRAVLQEFSLNRIIEERTIRRTYTVRIAIDDTLVDAGLTRRLIDKLSKLKDVRSVNIAVELLWVA